MNKLTLVQKLMYGSGYVGITLINTTLMWAMYFYAPPGGSLKPLLPIKLFGLAMLGGRIFDALTDSLVGHWSDRTRTRWGRRTPFIVFASLPLFISFVLIWMPPSKEVSILNFVWAACIISLFFFFFTCVIVPYLALLPEIAESSRERINLSALQGLFTIVGLGIGMIGSSFLISWKGFRWMSIIVGLVALISFYLPVIAVRETSGGGRREDLGGGRRSVGEGEKFEGPGVDRKNLEGSGKKDELQGEIPALKLKEALVETFRNKPFLSFIAGSLFFWFGFYTILTVAPYLVTEVMGRDLSEVGKILGVSLLVAVIFFPFMIRLSRKKGKRFAFLFSMSLFAIVLSLVGLIGRLGPVPIFYQGMVVIGLAGAPIAGLLILPHAIIADITDYDEKRTGCRREGMYFGIYGIVLKSAIGLSSVFVGFLLHHFGYTQANPLGILLCGPLAAVFILLGIFLFLRYPPTDVRNG